MFDQFKGKVVKIYPVDTDKKLAEFVDANESGVLFKIIHSEDPAYKPGSLHFIAFSARLTFSLG